MQKTIVQTHRVGVGTTSSIAHKVAKVHITVMALRELAGVGGVPLQQLLSRLEEPLANSHPHAHVVFALANS